MKFIKVFYEGSFFVLVLEFFLFGWGGGEGKKMFEGILEIIGYDRCISEVRKLR